MASLNATLPHSHSMCLGRIDVAFRKTLGLTKSLRDLPMIFPALIPGKTLNQKLVIGAKVVAGFAFFDLQISLRLIQPWNVAARGP